MDPRNSSPIAPATSAPVPPARGELVFVGGGGHALVVAEAAALSGWTVAGFLDDGINTTLAGDPIRAGRLGGLREFHALASPGSDRRWIIAVGDLRVRADLIGALGQLRRAGLPTTAHPTTGPASIIHPAAIVSRSVRVGAGVFVGPGAILHAAAEISDHAIINSGAIIEHECRIGANAHVAPGAVLGGRVKIGPGTLVGLGSRVLPNLSIGANCVIGAGAVVVRDVKNGEQVVGVPGRVATG